MKTDKAKKALLNSIPAVEEPVVEVVKEAKKTTPKAKKPTAKKSKAKKSEKNASTKKTV